MRQKIAGSELGHGGFPARGWRLRPDVRDAGAAAIAARAGVAIDQQPLQPVLRGALLTGIGTRFFEAELIAGRGFRSTVSDDCPSDPPTKIAARHLGPYLAAGDRHALALARSAPRNHADEMSNADEPLLLRDGTAVRLCAADLDVGAPHSRGARASIAAADAHGRLVGHATSAQVYGPRAEVELWVDDEF